MATGSRFSPRRIRPRQAVAGALEGVLPSTARPATPWAAKGAGEDYGVPAAPDWREINWRDHVCDVTVEERRIRYVELGAGEDPPIVFVHGLGGNWQNWLENLPAAAAGRRAFALDLPGFGESELPRGDISIAGYARTVDAWCEALGLGPVVVVGNSMGGFIGAEMAISFRQRVERLALVAAAGISITSLRRRPTMTLARVNAALSARTVARHRELIVRPRLRHGVLSFVFRHPRLVPNDLLFEVLQGMARPGFMPAMEALISYDFRDRLPEIACPTLVVWGREDMLVPIRDADEYERLIRDSRKVVMDDTGHVPMIERPAEFNRCLAQFIAEPRPAERGSVPTAAH